MDWHRFHELEKELPHPTWYNQDFYEYILGEMMDAIYIDLGGGG